MYNRNSYTKNNPKVYKKDQKYAILPKCLGISADTAVKVYKI
jgi:hypothetical protein